MMLVDAMMAMASIIAIDTGHSPRKAGARSAGGIAEYEFNRRQADVVASWVSRSGANVRRVGWQTQGDDLVKRARAADGADLLVSIHHDSVQPASMTQVASIRGFSIFVSGRNPHYAQSLRCARIIGQALVGAGHRPNAYHALPIGGEGHAMVDAARGVYRRDGLAITSTGTVPTVLVEIGVIANPSEEAWLSRPEVAEAIGAVIAGGAANCVRTSSVK